MDGKNILVDIGVTNKNILIALEKININPKDIDVIFITHEHIDHVRGLKVFLKNNSPIVYMNKKTYNELDFEIENIAFVEENFQIDKLNVEIVKTSHDAIDSFGIIFNGKNGKFVHITDTGYINGKVVKKIQDARAYLIESNYEHEVLIKNDKYPFKTKQRISSDKGHLSNEQCFDYLQRVVTSNTEYILYAHLSEQNNEHHYIEKRIKEIDVENQIILLKDELVEVSFEK